MPTPPALTAEQRRAALEKAAAVRRTRGEARAKLKAGELDLGDLLAAAEQDEALASMKVLAVLESLPRVGKVGARRLLGELGIAESRRIQGLGAHQLAALRSHGAS